MSDTRLRLILELRDKVLAPLRGIQSGSKDAAAALKATRDQLRDLEKAQQDIDGLRKTRAQLRGQQRDLQDLQGKLAGSNASLTEHRERHRNIAASLKTARESHGKLTKALQDGATATPEFSRQLEMARIRLLSSQTAYERSNSTLSKYRTQIKTTEAGIAQLSGKIDNGKDRLQGYLQRLERAGISTERLGQQSRNQKTQIEAATAAMERQKQALAGLKAQQDKLAALKANHAKSMMHTGMAVGAGVGMAAAGRKGIETGMGPVKVFSEHQDHMLGIARQIDGARDSGGQLTPIYYALEEQIRGLSHRIPLATTAITDMVTAAARMEVPRDKLAEFTLMASEMATAFDAVPDEITESMGKVAKNFKIPTENIADIRSLADSINYLDDNAISKGADIIGFLNRTSGVISTVAMSAKDAAALGSTLLTLGEREETAATAANAIVQKFAAASKGTKKFQAALKEVGLNSNAVQKGMAKDATATLLKVVQSIQKLPEDKRIGVMVELVGLEHSDTLAKLVDKPEELQRQLKLANSGKAQGSMSREADARNQTLSAQWQTMKNRAFNLNAAIGGALEPVLIRLMQAVNPLIEGFAAFVNEHKVLAKWVLGGVVAISALFAVLGTLLIPLALIAGKFMLIRFLFGVLGIKVPMLSAGISALTGVVTKLAGALFSGLMVALRATMGVIVKLGVALLTTPVGWFVLAIAAIAGAAYLIYNNWSAISGFFSGVWGSVKTQAAAAWTSIKASLSGLWSSSVSTAQTIWAGLPGFFSGMWQGIKNTASAVWSGIASMLGQMWTAMVSTASTLWQQMGGSFPAVLQTISTAIVNWSPLGLFYQAFAGVMSYFGLELPTKFSEFGANIIQGLVNGITSKVAMVRDAVGGAADSAIGWFKEKLGIHSPSRVFMAAGVNVGEGAAIGIGSTVDMVRKSAAAMAMATGVTLAAPTVAAPVMPVPQVGMPTLAAQQQSRATPALQPAAQPLLPVLQKLPPVPAQVVQLQPAAAQALPPAAQELLPTLQTLPRVPAQVVPLQPAAAPVLPPAAQPLLPALQKLPPMPAQYLPAMPAMADPVQIDRRPVLAKPAPAAQRPAPIIQGDTITIQVYGSPGMDMQELAREVQRQLDQRDRAKAARLQASYTDWN